jgi:signal transduction histidine kinase
VSVRLIAENQENTTVEFAVSDTGIGIPKEK